jgi:beta-N-acetylhexosaminidase
MKLVVFIVKVLLFSVIVFFASSFIDFGSTRPQNFGLDSEFPDLQGNYAERYNKPMHFNPGEPDFVRHKSKWTDSVFNTLSLDEKIGQLILVATSSKMGPEHKQSIERMIKKYKIGGLVFFQGSPVKQAQLTNYYQSVSKTPLFIAMDAEWGLSMRLDSTVNYPRQMMMGAIQDDQIIYDFGVELGRQCNRLGVHINFAPVIDINNNPRNPVINSRSFGENRLNVAQKGLAYMLGLQNKNVITSAKHFPGHGDTESDSHHTLPVITHSYQRLDSLELFPFKYLIDNGLTGVMVAHLHIPVLDSSDYTASSLSYNIITRLLKQRMKFNGLVFTDALGMKGVSSFYPAGEIALKAFMAGTDILLMPPDIEAAVRAIKTALNNGMITEKDIDERCYKVLQAKKWAGLDNYKPVEIKGLTEDLNSGDARYINQRIVESAITLVENKEGLIPLKNLDKIKVASVSIGSGNYSKFQKTLSLYGDVTHFSIEKNADISQYRALLNKLTGFDLVIVAYLKSNYSPSSFGITGNSVWFGHELANYTKVIVNLFASPYVLTKFRKGRFHGIIVSYEDNELSQDFSAQLIYGGIPALGKLPVSAGIEYPVRTGITNEKVRLKYADPRELKIDDTYLKTIDTIILGAIEQGAMPGCQVLAAKNGLVFFYKSYGYHTYDKSTSVGKDDLYDLASITKISATLPVIMKLSEDGKITLNDKLTKYFPELDTTNKKNITIKQVLAHQSGLISWIPFYLRGFDPSPNSNYDLRPELFQAWSDSVFCLKIADNLFMNKAFVDSMYLRIYNSPVKKKVSYRYSDLGFYLFYRLIEDKLRIDFKMYLEKEFYGPLGLTSLCFNPLDKFSRDRIVPTENDKKFRKQLVHGYVHDYGAAMMGGVGGHAGLFSNANDLAKIMQMYLQFGEYGGQKFLKPKTIDEFTTSAFSKTKNRRALGFDKPGLAKKSPVTKSASSESYGHTGFTGTIAWVDPKEQFIFIFLSNRIHPNAENNKLGTLQVRHRVHETFYKSFNTL